MRCYQAILLFQLLAAVATYVVVMLQFQQSVEQHAQA